MTSMTRAVGTHMALIGLLATNLAPSAAFAATDTKTATLNVNVASVMSLTVASPSSAFNLIPGSTSTQTQTANLTVQTNAQHGYNITALGSNAGSSACTSSVLCHTDNTTPIVDATSIVYNGTGAGTATGTGSESGLIFRMKSTVSGTDTQLDIPTRWGTDGSSPKWAAFPMVSAQTIANSTASAAASMSTAAILPVDYKVTIPSSQKEGAYSGTVTYTATTNA